MNYGEMIKWKYPGSSHSVGETYDSLLWLDANKQKPTEIEFNQAVLDYQATLDLVSYKRKRMVKYNDRGSTNEARLDALWDKIVENNTVAADALQVIRMQVKLEEPKPT